MMKLCKNCNSLLNRKDKIYCNNVCQQAFQHKQYIERWKTGLEKGVRGNGTSKHIRDFLFTKYDNKCQVCGWNKTNEFTGNVPLQIHHVDGDWKNNREENLQLLCPNCHTLTDNFGSRNRTDRHRYGT